MKFSDWLIEQLREMDWTQAELSRASGLTRSAISKYMTGRTPDEAALRKLAKGLHLPVESVYRAAGLLPPKPTTDPWVEEMDYKLHELRGSRREMAERLIEVLLDEQEREEGHIYKTVDP